MTKLLFRLFLLALILTISTALFIVKKQADYQFQAACHDSQAQAISLQLLNDYLSNFPANTWELELQKVIRQFRSINILPISALTLKQQQQLHKQAWLCLADPVTKQFSAAYKLTKNPDYVFQVYDDLHHEQTARFKLGLLQHLLEKKLHHLPKTQWKNYLQQLSNSSDINIPISLHDFNAIDLPKQNIQQLQQQHWTVTFPQQSVDINTVYSFSSALNQVIQYGPINVPFNDVHIAYRTIIYVFIVFSILALLLIASFLHSLNKLNKLANHYSAGNFSSAIRFNRLATLYPLYQHLTNMGQRIKRLLNSQRDLSNAIAHELRTPLSSLRFSLQLLKESDNQQQRQQRSAEIEKDLTELETLISEILNYAKLDQTECSVNYQAHSWDTLISTLEKRFTKYAKDIILQVDIPVAIKQQTLLTDEKYFLRAVENIMKNAAHFAKHRVKLTIKQYQKFGYQLLIEDDGFGIAIDDRQRIFTPFIQLQSDSSGYGLGLAISKKIIEQQGGTINITDSTLGGASFCIQLPNSRLPTN